MKKSEFKKLRPLSSSLSKLKSVAAVCSALSLATAISSAKDFQWDSDAIAGNGVTGGGGTWNTTTTNWFDGASLGVWPNASANTDKAIFTSTGGIVNLGVPIFARTLQFDGNGYTIANGGTAANTLTLSGATPSIAVTNDADTATISAALAGSTAWTKLGDGNLVLSGQNTYSGALLVTAGTLTAGSSTALGSAAGGTTIANGATLEIGDSNLGSEAVTVRGAGDNGVGAIVNRSGSGQLNALANVTLSGDTTFGGTARWDIRATGGTGQLSTGGGAFNITKIGTNQINLANLTVDESLGDITVTSGILGIEGTTTLGDPSRTITVASGATVQFTDTTTTSNALDKAFTLNGGTSASGATLNQTSGSTVVLGLVTMTGTRNTFNVAGGRLTIFGRLSGTSAITKTGPGVLAISSFSNDFSGAVSVTGGTIQFDAVFAFGSTPGITVSPNAAIAAGYPIDQTFIRKVVTSSQGSIALAVDSSNDLDFSLENLASASLGATGNSSFTGTLTPSGTTYRLGGGGGTLTLPNPNALTGARSLIVTNGSTVVLANSNNLTGTVTVSSGTLAVAATGGAGTVPVTVASGATLQIGNGGATGVLTNSSITGAGTLSFNRLDNYTFSQTLGGTLTVNQAAVATTTLAIPAASRLSFTAGGRIDLGSTSINVGVDGGNLLQVTAATTGTVIASAGGSIKLAVNGGDFGAVAGGTLIVDAPIVNGAGSTLDISNAGAGTVAFRGANTYNGATNILSGTLVASSLNRVSGGTASSNLGAPTTVANGTINISGTAASGLRYTGVGESTDRVINLQGATAAVTLDQSGSGTLAFTSDFTATGGGSKTLILQGSTSGAGQISGKVVDNSAANKTSLLKTGTGTWTLSGANLYTGTTSVNGGTLRLDFSAAAGASDIVSASSGLVLGGGRLAVNGKAGGTNSQTFAGTALNPGGSSVVVTNDPSSNTVAVNLGAITRTSGATADFVLPVNGVTSATNGIVTSTANNAAGILGGYATVSGKDWATVSGTNIVAYTGYVAMPATGGTATTNSSLTGGKAQTGPTTLNSLKIADSGASQSLALGVNTLTLSGANGAGGLLYVGGTSNTYTISGGTLTAGANDLIINSGGTGTPTLTVSSAISGSGGLTKAGAGTLVLSGTNSFTGDINVNGGTLAINGPGTTVDPASLGASGPRLINLNGSTFKLNNNSYNPNQNTKVFAIGGGGGTLEVVSGTLTLDDGNSIAGSGTAFGAPQLQGSGVLTKSGAGTLQLGSVGQASQTPGGNGFSGFSGNLVVAAGTVQVGDSNALGSTAGSTTVQSGATLDFYSSPQSHSEALTVSGTGVGGNGALVNTSGNAIVLNGPVALAGATSIGGTGSGGMTINGGFSNSSAASSLTKVGTGTVTLNGANTFVSGTALNVNDGTLAIGLAGSISGVTNVTVATGSTLNVSASNAIGGYSIPSGQTVGGKGAITGDLSVKGSLDFAGTVTGGVTATTGTIAPGGLSAAGTLAATGSFSLLSTAKLWLELGTTVASASDRISLSGTAGASLGGATLQLTLLPTFANKVGDVFTLILNGGSGALAGVFGNVTPTGGTTGTITLAGGQQFQVNYAANLDSGAIGNDVTATLVAVPEPSTFMALLGGIGTLVGFKRRRNRAR